MIDPGVEFGPGDPWGNNNVGGNNEEAWRERQRRQQSVRFIMMFLLTLLLMDGEEQNQRQRMEANLAKKRNKVEQLPPDLFEARQAQDERIRSLTADHPRFQKLITKNGGQNTYMDIRKWVQQQLELQKDEFAQDTSSNKPADNKEEFDPEVARKVWHYPWNSTGFYRGEWQREDPEKGDSASFKEVAKIDTQSSNTSSTSQKQYLSPHELESTMLHNPRLQKDLVGVYLFPENTMLKADNRTFFFKDFDSDKKRKRHNAAHQSPFLRANALNLYSSKDDSSKGARKITLNQDSGRAAFQLYARTVYGITELSLVDGFVKLYDSNTVGYSTRRDLLLRVNGVLVHSTGKLSLVSNANHERSALVIAKTAKTERRRLLMDIVASPDHEDHDLQWIRNEALTLFDESDLHDREQWSALTSFPPSKDDQHHRRLLDKTEIEVHIGEKVASATKEEKNKDAETKATTASDFVIPFPFVPDDDAGTIRKVKTPAARKMPPREQILEENMGSCEFEISMNVQEEEWTVGEWRALLVRHAREALDMVEKSKSTKTTTGKGTPKAKKKPRKQVQDQALVLTINGTVVSENCNFVANVNATAIRTDWQNTTGKAINYSFYMLLTCLTQIVVLLRQLLHTQSQSAAARVSLLCIGWQTVLDALLCLIHIYLALAMQPVFTAFASIAFFKLLIFCVIEMKYMAIIMQARNANNGGNTTELLRRQVAMLHLRFYVALVGSFLAFFYAGDSYRTIYMLILYSFWVPQIVQNVITEAKHPLHPYYIYGTAVSRLVAPIYVFAVKNNFLKEVYPDSPTNTFMVQLVVLWVVIQTGVLVAQERYGARFMIPARFLPPKFDYNRPIPQYLMPAEAIDSSNLTPSETLEIERATTGSQDFQPLISREVDGSHTASSGGTRKRTKGQRVNRTDASMTSESVSNSRPADPGLPQFDCVICYNDIDIRNRRGYMLAPCDHIFHKDCLMEWMNQKMECPICRTALPAL
jgi:transmembrane E3 ubiquitin-protein ligase